MYICFDFDGTVTRSKNFIIQWKNSYPIDKDMEIVLSASPKSSKFKDLYNAFLDQLKGGESV